MNVLFGKNKTRIFDEIMTKFMPRSTGLRLQIHPYRISPLSELSDNARRRDHAFVYTHLRNELRQHLTIVNDINSSSIKSPKFDNVIFVNYTTKELEPALRFDRVRYYLCDYVNDENIDLLTLTNLVFVNFLKKQNNNNDITSLNSHFMTYSTLVFHDTAADERVADTTTLDIGGETTDDVTYILKARLQTDNDGSGGVILPYHPFRQSKFAAVENIKNNINAISLTKNKHLIYYPFEQNEWLEILKLIMYEHVLLNFLVSDRLYVHERVAVNERLHKSIVSCCYRHFADVQRHYKTHVINDIVFNYHSLFRSRNGDKTHWLKSHYIISNVLPQMSTNFQCTRSPIAGYLL